MTGSQRIKLFCRPPLVAPIQPIQLAHYSRGEGELRGLSRSTKIGLLSPNLTGRLNFLRSISIAQWSTVVPEDAAALQQQMHTSPHPSWTRLRAVFGRLAVGEMRVLSMVLNEPLRLHPLLPAVLQFTSFFLSPLWLILRTLDDGIF